MVSASQRNLVITGFMGTGKSTVGPLVASRLSRAFVDFDDYIEEEQGASCEAIMLRHGERYFRGLESQACRALHERRAAVIATGGGTLLSQENADLMASTGVIVCLDCELEEIWRRIGTVTDRPILGAPGPQRYARMASLLAERAEAYSRFEHHIDVTTRTPLEVLEELLKLVRGMITWD